jgi:2-methylisocitrate lyase-like PEP mutase family enzyme
MPFNPQTSTQLAQKLRSLHVPGSPILLTNIWDPPSVSLALANPSTKAIATASFAIAACAGLEDPELTLEVNLAAISKIAARMEKERRSGDVPLTVDLQGGYQEKLQEVVEKVVKMGVVGCNLEDSKEVDGKTVLVSAEEHARRVKLVIQTTSKMGVNGFVVNARVDCVTLGGTVEEAIERGKKYLEAGATTVFVWGGMKRGLRDGEVKKLVEGLDGRVNVIYRKSIEGALSTREIADLGVARISLGPGLWREAMASAEEEMRRVIEAHHKKS